MKITSCIYFLPRILLFTIITELHAVDDPCSGIDSKIVVDMCTDEHVVEDSKDGYDKIDSVVVRVMEQKANCTCRVSLKNIKGSHIVQMRKYQGLSSSAPLTENCGLAIDVDYPEVIGYASNRYPINCISGTTKRVIGLEKNGVIELKSRIISGNFSRGYCMQIYRDNLMSGDPVQLNIQCDDPENTTTIPTTHASATTKYKNKQSSTDKIASTADTKGNAKTSTVTTKGYNKEEEIASTTNTNDNYKTSTVTTKGYNKEEEDDHLELYIYIGVGAGGMLIIIVILMIILCIRNRSKKKTKKEEETANDRNDPDSDSGELKDNILYVSADQQDIIEDGNYNTVDLEKKRIVNESTRSGVEDSTADGNYSSIGATDNSPDTRNKPKPAVNFSESDKQRQQISTFENSNNEYAVVDKGRKSDIIEHGSPLLRNSSETDMEMSVLDKTYAVVDKTNRRKADE
ncbi:uncharacterized protein LOC127725212 isoform X2 [Mytilus californianus]|uniref:uncharacterized protein LOC127725212 isoform X1 n=1 Tax=Mytilus californianus TaxID=6549 RepID=UPI00224842D2|nr:uncharacterized protein LOC127725212 isoform X1 [Mytilus californianus]XP_052088026.1 uncharacterized protein LOC127725212 isoform X2 [Mytilus californianus]